MQFVPLISEDISDLQSLATKIWNENYQEMISQSQIDYMLDWMYSTEKVNQDLEAGHFWNWIDVDGARAGFIHYYPKDSAIFLSKIYLDGPYQGKGVAQYALSELSSITGSMGQSEILLTVNKNNRKALKFYEKDGFKIYGEEVFDIGKGYVMDDYLMRKAILPKET